MGVSTVIVMDISWIPEDFQEGGTEVMLCDSTFVDL